MTLLLVASLLAVIFFVLTKKKKNDKKTPINLSVFETPIGWGYKIDIDKKTFIYQPFIPVIETHAGFPNKETATNAGNIIINKIRCKQPPILTLTDLQRAGICINKKVQQRNDVIN